MNTATKTFHDALVAYGSCVKEIGGEYSANCPGPSHERGDKNPSLRFRGAGDDVLIHCHAGCSNDHILSALGLTWRALRDDSDQFRVSGAHKREAARGADTLEAFCRERGLDVLKLKSDWGVQLIKLGGVPHLSYPTPWGINRLKNLAPGTLKDKYRWATKFKNGKQQPGWYGLDKLLRGTELVYLTNGEPSVWACHQAGVPAICTCAGEGKRLDAALLGLLADRGVKRVQIVFDLDRAGIEGAAAAAVAFRDTGIEATVLKLPDYLGEKGDVGDLFKREGPAFVKALKSLPVLDRADVSRAAVVDGVFKPYTSLADARTEGAILLALVEGVELFVDDTSDTYIRYPVGKTKLTTSLDALEFEGWLMQRFYDHTRRGPKTQALKEAVRLLKSLAGQSGLKRNVYVRVGAHGDRIYVDLADNEYRVIEVDGRGYRLVPDPPILFIRHRGMLPLPFPEVGGRLEDLRPLLNLSDDNLWYLAVGWLLSTLLPTGPRPLLIVKGVEGSLKSSLCRIVRRIVDPHAVPLRALAGSERDLAISAKRNHVLAFDNISTLSHDLSDALCRLATGGGLSTRVLYTDDGEKLFSSMRSVILNGIEDAARNPDILSRAVTLELPHVDESEFITERELEQRLQLVLPKALGALLQVASYGLQHPSESQLIGLGRMADFVAWVAACEPALGWVPGTFRSAYLRNREEQIVIALSSDPLAEAVIKFMADRPEWSGTVTDLRARLESFWNNYDRATYSLMNQNIGGRLRRLISNLKKVGITATEVRTAKQRTWHLRRVLAELVEEAS